jgi:hypothetical protein
VEVGRPAKELTIPPAEPPDMDKLMAIAAKYDIDILGSLPGQQEVWVARRDVSALLLALIHPSMWKWNSANFRLTAFSEVRPQK